MKQYQFEKIFSQMGNEYGKIMKGCEQEYEYILAPIEMNALKIHRSNPTANSRKFIEALALALFDIKSRITNETYDVDCFRNEDNTKLEHAILMAFDPYTNKIIEKSVKTNMDEEELRQFYKEPIMCIIRIKDSAEMWIKEYGGDGYFYFLENTIGKTIKGDAMEYVAPNENKDNMWKRISQRLAR